MTNDRLDTDWLGHVGRSEVAFSRRVAPAMSDPSGYHYHATAAGTSTDLLINRQKGEKQWERPSAH